MNHTSLTLSFLAVCSAALFTSCDDPRNRTGGTVQSLAAYSVADDTIKQARIQLGGAYSTLASARTPAEFNASCQFLSSDQLGTVSSVKRQLANCVTVIEKQPGTQAATLADSLILQNQGFLVESPQVLRGWQSVRQRMQPH